MEKHDYVIVYWIGVDLIPTFEYDYLYNINHNQAVDIAKKRSLKASVDKYSDLIIQETERELPLDPADVYEEVMNDFIQFQVWEVLPETPKEAFDEFDVSPDVFCSHWCIRVA